MAERSELRETLIVAALGILETTGEEPSLRAVARAAGVSAMAPYNHFADKAALMAAVATHGFEALHAALAAADERADPREALVAQGLAFIAFARANPALFRLMYAHHYGSAGAEAVAATYKILADRVAGIAPDRTLAATLASRALAQGIATIELCGRLTPSEAGEIETALRILVDGLGRSGAPHG